MVCGLEDTHTALFYGLEAADRPSFCDRGVVRLEEPVVYRKCSPQESIVIF